MNLKRTNLIMETGPYGGGGSGGKGSGTMSTPVSTRRFNTWPFTPDAQIMLQKEKERIRRRNRLRELALGWYILGPGQSSNASVAASGAAPGKIF